MMERRAFDPMPEEGQRPVYEDCWENAGDPGIEQDYQLFAVLANVRNKYGIPFIAELRGIPKDCTGEYHCWATCDEGWAHSHSWVTLAELKAFDVTQTYFDQRYIFRDADGKEVRTSYHPGTPEETFEQIGETTVFGVFGEARWCEIIDTMESVKRPYHTDDDDVSASGSTTET